MVERGAGAGDQVDALDEFPVGPFPGQGRQFGIAMMRHGHGRPPLSLQVPLVQEHVVCPQVVHAAELVAAADRPVERRGGDAEHALDFIEQLQRIASLGVALVDEGQDRQSMAAAHLEEL